MLRRLAAASAGLLLLVSGVPADAATRAAPTMSLVVNPRYPQVGHPARLTVRVRGAHGPAAGWVRFRFDGTVIAGCNHVVLHSGAAGCTAPVSWRAKRTFVVGYKGSAAYRPKVLTSYVWS